MYELLCVTYSIVCSGSLLSYFEYLFCFFDAFNGSEEENGRIGKQKFVKTAEIQKSARHRASHGFSEFRLKFNATTKIEMKCKKLRKKIHCSVVVDLQAKIAKLCEICVFYLCGNLLCQIAWTTSFGLTLNLSTISFHYSSLFRAFDSLSISNLSPFSSFCSSCFANRLPALQNSFHQP